MTDEIIKIAITGKMRAGKDKAAWSLFYEHGFETPISFGTRLKLAAEKLFPDYVIDGGKPRELYQKFGQLCRGIDPEVWIKPMEISVGLSLDSRRTKGIVITDVRQPNEYKWCRDNGFTIIRVVASDEVRLQRAKEVGDVFSEMDLFHETELHSDGFEVDYEIDNNGDIDALGAQIYEIITELKAKGERLIDEV